MGSLACVLPVLALGGELLWTPAAPAMMPLPGRAHAGWSVSVCGADRLPATLPGAVLPPWEYLVPMSAQWLRLREPCVRAAVRGPDEALTVWQVGGWSLEHGVSVEPTTPPAADPRLLSRLDQMAVQILAADGTVRACDPPLLGRAWCGPDGWNWVGATRVPVRGVEHDCIWAHPTPEGVLSIGWEVQGPAQLQLRHALADAAADGGAPVEVAVYVDGEEQSRRTHRPRPGWQTQRVPVPDGGPHRVEVRVWAEDPGRRHLCLDGELGPPSTRTPIRSVRGPRAGLPLPPSEDNVGAGEQGAVHAPPPDGSGRQGTDAPEAP